MHTTIYKIDNQQGPTVQYKELYFVIIFFNNLYRERTDLNIHIWDSLVSQTLKNLPTLWVTWVQSLGWEDPLEKGTVPTPVFWPGKFH